MHCDYKKFVKILPSSGDFSSDPRHPPGTGDSNFWKVIFWLSAWWEY